MSGNDASHWKTYAPGEALFREGESSKAAYLIISGEVNVVKDSGGAQEKVLARIGAGEYVGEMGVIDDLPRSASAIANSQTVAMAVSPELFMEMIMKNPEEAIDLIKVLFERLRAANAKLAKLNGEGLN